MISLDGSEIHNSRISGMRNGIRLNNNSKLSKSVVHDIRGQALELSNGISDGNIFYDIGLDYGNTGIRVNWGSTFTNNRIYSTVSDPNMTAIQASGNSLVQGNTIGSDRGIHGRFGFS